MDLSAQYMLFHVNFNMMQLPCSTWIQYRIPCLTQKENIPAYKLSNQLYSCAAVNVLNFLFAITKKTLTFYLTADLKKAIEYISQNIAETTQHKELLELSNSWNDERLLKIKDSVICFDDTFIHRSSFLTQRQGLATYMFQSVIIMYL